jgi:polysaccharide export outer membrane protein
MYGVCGGFAPTRGRRHGGVQLVTRRLVKNVFDRTAPLICALLAAATLLLAAPASCRAQAPAAPAAGSSTAQQSSMVAPIGPNDLIHIDVVGEPDLSKDYDVDANGDITMLYVGKIHLGGLTPDEATTQVRTVLAGIYVSPQVTLTRGSVGGLSVTVTGDVAHQGTQTIRRDARLNDAVQLAGLQPDSDLSKVQITRGLPGQQHTTLTFDLSAFLANGDAGNNPPLQDGDVLFIPNRAPVTYSVSVVGAVVKGGRFDVAPGTTVYDLIKQAGGLEDDADRTSIYIQPTGTLDRIPFNYDLAKQSPADATQNRLLKDGDKVVVPEESTVPVFAITGAVLKPGQYPLHGKMSLTDAEGVAGGLMPHAKADQITITREGTNQAQVIKLNASDPTVAANFALQPGDNIYIPQGSAPTRIDPMEAIGVVVGLFGIFR